jgi:hypothetical protein
MIAKKKFRQCKGEWKKGHSKGTEAHQAAKRQRGLDAQKEVLDLPVLEGRMATLRKQLVLIMKDA